MVETTGLSPAKADVMTARDRRALEYRGALEKEQHRHLGGGLVQSYVQSEFYVLSDVEDIGDLVFDVRGIKDAILSGKLQSRVYKADLTPKWYDYTMELGGVERARLDQMQDDDGLRRLGVACRWPDGTMTMIDGNHRLAKSYELGKPSFRFVMVQVLDCLRQDMICRRGEEERFLRKLDGAVTLSVETAWQPTLEGKKP